MDYTLPALLLCCNGAEEAYNIGALSVIFCHERLKWELIANMPECALMLFVFPASSIATNSAWWRHTATLKESG